MMVQHTIRESLIASGRNMRQKLEAAARALVLATPDESPEINMGTLPAASLAELAHAVDGATSDAYIYLTGFLGDRQPYAIDVVHGHLMVGRVRVRVGARAETRPATDVEVETEKARQDAHKAACEAMGTAVGQ